VVWDDANPLKRFAKRPDLMRDPAWNRQLSLLKRYDLKCGFYAFGDQLPDLIEVVRSHPDIGFTIGLIGWPLDLSDEGFARWKHHTAELAACDNVRLDISALECLFGMRWTMLDAARWVSTTIDTMSVSRCMFGSHLPIACFPWDLPKSIGAMRIWFMISRRVKPTRCFTASRTAGSCSPVDERPSPTNGQRGVKR
jgi:predicted TIM-barrel fold metal-dependent hydrolase